MPPTAYCQTLSLGVPTIFKVDFYGEKNIKYYPSSEGNHLSSQLILFPRLIPNDVLPLSHKLYLSDWIWFHDHPKNCEKCYVPCLLRHTIRHCLWECLQHQRPHDDHQVSVLRSVGSVSPDLRGCHVPKCPTLNSGQCPQRGPLPGLVTNTISVGFFVVLDQAFFFTDFSATPTNGFAGFLSLGKNS